MPLQPDKPVEPQQREKQQQDMSSFMQGIKLPTNAAVDVNFIHVGASCMLFEPIYYLLPVLTLALYNSP